jgi:hypothetical protein
MREKILVVVFAIISTSAFAQLANVTYTTQTANIQGYENATGGACWETGEEEYSAYVYANDNVNATEGSSGCQQCSNNGNCTYGQNVLLLNRTNNAYSIVSRINAWEDDRGSRCSYDCCNTFLNDDDCRRSTSNQSYNFREAGFPSNNTYNVGPSWGSTNDHRWQLRTTWRYANGGSQISPGCTPNTVSYASGAIRSYRVSLVAGQEYNFTTCSGTTEDTYLRLYGTNGYTIVSFDDDDCGLQSTITYTPTFSGVYYIEISRVSRNPLNSGGTLTYWKSVPAAVSVSGAGTYCTQTTLNATGGAGGAIYWQGTTNNGTSTATASSSQTVTTSGTYYFRSRSVDGCWGVQGIAVMTILPAFNAGSITGGGGTQCSPADPGAMTVTPSGGSGSYTYQWYAFSGASCPSSGGTLIPLATNATYDPPAGLNATTTYRVQVDPIGTPDCGVATWSNNCITITVKPTPSAPNLTSNTPLCVGSELLLSVNSPIVGVVYGWSGPGSYSTSGTNPTRPNITLGQAGDYSATATLNGCISLAGLTNVVVNPLPVGTISGATTICEGDATDLTFNFTVGAGPFDIDYFDGSNTFSLSGVTDGQTVSVSPSSTTVYSISEITDSNGCTNSSVSSSTDITVNPSPNGSISLVTPICLGDETTLTFNFSPGTGPFDIGFTDGVSNFSLTGVNNGGTFDVEPPTSVTYNFTSITDALTCARTSGFTGGAQVIVNPLPSVSFSGLASDYCEVDAPIILTGNQAPSGTFSGNGIVDFANGTASFDPSGAGVGPHTITYTVTDINVCTSSEDQSVSVEVQPVADAGSGGDACDLNFDLAANPSVAAGQWSQTGGPLSSFSNFVPNANDPNATVSVSQYGNYEFTWSEGVVCSSSDAVSVNFYEQPLANAGTNGNECQFSHVFNAVPSVGNGTWTQVSGPGTSSYVDATSATTTVTATLVGQYVYQWEEVNGTCSDASTVTVNYFAQPVANAGFGGGECDFDFQLGATPSVGIGTWTATGPGTVTYTPNANDPAAIAEVSAYGIYIFTWSEDNFGCTDDASITVNFDQQTNANAGAGGDECDLNFTFTGSPSIGSGIWTAAGTGNAFYSDPNSPTATVTVDTYGAYLFTWTETNGNCTAVDQVSVNFFEQPVADAGLGGDECDLNFQFAANPSVGDGLWLQTNGPGASTFLVDSDPSTTVTVTQYGTYTYSWSETNGTCSDNSTVVVNYYEQPVANAGSGGDECDLDFTLNGVSSVGVGLWTATGPGTATFVNDISATTDVSVSAYGTYTFTWTEINGTCFSAASVTVNFYEQPTAVAGLGGDECNLDFLTAAVPSVGTGLWSQTGGIGTATFSNASSAINMITVDTYGTYEFTWTETNGTCIDFRTMTVNFYEQPVANAGLGGDECDLDFTLAATASVGSGEWTFTGPGTATFGSSAAASTVVTVSPSGAYTFTWTETNVVCVNSDDVVVNFFDQSVADAGTGGDECDLNFVFSAVPSFGTGTWTGSGPGNTSFTNVNSATSTTTVDAYGTYTFTWTEVNGICSNAASVTVNFYEQPVANAGNATDQCDLDFTFTGTASVGTGTWTSSGPGTATFSPNANDVNATVTVDASGSYTFTWTEDNNGCVDSDDLVIAFNALPTVSFTGLDAQYCVDISTPVALIGSPAGGTFSGLGISSNSFVPSVAGVGTIFVTYTYTDANGCTDSETQSVDVNGLPNVSFSGLDAAYCEDDATAYTLVGLPSGGTFSGSGISADQFTPSVANNGTHVVTYSYTDAFGCSSSEQQSTVVNELPVVSFTGLSSAYCEDASSVALIGTPNGGTFAGPGIIGNSFSPVAAASGLHTIVYTYTDGNGCTNTSVQQVAVNDLPLPVITPSGTSDICAGENITLDAGAGFAGYLWSNGANGQSISVDAADDYSVTVTTAAGCVGTSADVTVIVNALPVVDLGPDTTVCTGSTFTLDAGNLGLDFSWSTFEITQSITVSTTGVYSVDVTNSNGCVGTDEILVSVSTLLDPVVVANGPVIFCDGDSVSLDAGSGYLDYSWSNGSSDQVITVSTPGVFEVTVVDQFGCSGSDDEIVSILQLPNAVIQPSGTIAICSADTVTLSASNTFASYEWSPGLQTTPSIEVWQAGTYTVTVVDPNNGCEATSDEVVVTVNSSVPPTIVPSGATEFCAGGSVSLSVAPGPYSSFLWSSGSTTPSIVITQTGDYGVTVLDANGCLDSTLQGNPLSIQVWDPNPQVVEEGDSLVVTNGPFAQHQWYFNGAPIPGATAYFHIPTESGNFYVEVWDENDCQDGSSNIEYTFTGIADLGSLYNIKVYPNPTNNFFTLEVDFGKRISGTISLMDMTGRQIMTPENLSDVSSIRRTFDMEHLAKGVYQLRLVTQEGVAVKSIIRN